MSWKQRRDHHPVPDERDGYAVCRTCGDRLALVMGYGAKDYWRHWRRFAKKGSTDGRTDS